MTRQGAAPRPLAYLGEAVTLLQDDHRYRWIILKSFAIHDGSVDDRGLLSALLCEDAYDDNMATVDSIVPGQDIHGPFRLSALSASDFSPVTVDRALVLLDGLATNDSDIPHDDPQFAPMVDVLRTPATAIHHLTAGEERWHEWGWVIGKFSFLEFVVVDRANSALTAVCTGID